MTQVELQSLWISRLSQPFNCVTVPKQVGVDPFVETRFSSHRLDYLPCPATVDVKKPLVDPKFLLVCVTLQTVYQSDRNRNCP